MEFNKKDLQIIDDFKKLTAFKAGEQLRNNIRSLAFTELRSANPIKLFTFKYAIFALLLLVLSGSSYVVANTKVNGISISEKVIKLSPAVNKDPETKTVLKSEDFTRSQDLDKQKQEEKLETGKTPESAGSVKNSDEIKTGTPEDKLDLNNLNVKLPADITIDSGGIIEKDNQTGGTPTPTPEIKAEIDLPLLNETQINIVVPKLELGL